MVEIDVIFTELNPTVATVGNEVHRIEVLSIGEDIVELGETVALAVDERDIEPIAIEFIEPGDQLVILVHRDIDDDEL